MPHFISINRAVLKAAIKERLLQRIADEAAGSVTHRNRDNVYSPASWWADYAHTDRRTLSTSATLGIAGGAVTIDLFYSC